MTTQQLKRAGFTSREIERRLERGILIRRHRGVYRLGHAAPSVEADYMEAVLVCGDGAVLADLAAAHLLGIVKGRAPRPSVIARARRSYPGARRAILHRSEVTRWRGIPVTTAARTLVDLAAVLGVDELALACHNAGVRHRTNRRQVKDVLARRPNARGAAKFVPIFEGDSPAFLSWMERRAFQLFEAAGFPRPQVNRRRGSNYIDLRWPEERVSVELISYRYHRSRHAWEDDARRRRSARKRGDEFRSYTYEDVLEERTMIEELRGLLGPP